MSQGNTVAHILANQSIYEPRFTAILYHLLFRKDFRTFIKEKSGFDLSGYISHDCFAHVNQELIKSAKRKKPGYRSWDDSEIDMMLSDILLCRSPHDESILIQWPRTKDGGVMIPGTDAWVEIFKSDNWENDLPEEHIETIRNNREQILERATLINSEADLLIITREKVILVENKVKDKLNEKQAMKYQIMLEMLSRFYGDSPSAQFLLINSSGSTPESIKLLKPFDTAVLSWKDINLWAQTKLPSSDQTYLRTIIANASEHKDWESSDQPDAWYYD